MTSLTFGCQLNNEHINLAQKLLQIQFPYIEDLASTLTQTKARLIFSDVRYGFLCILHIAIKLTTT